MAEEHLHKLQISGPEGFSLEFIIPLGISSLGRQAGNDIHLDHPQISRSHARLVCTKTECEISDEGSSNGTFVNEEQLTPKAPVILSSGDVIRAGEFVLTYHHQVVEAPGQGHEIVAGWLAEMLPIRD